MFYPGWKAKINDKISEIYRVDFILRGLFVPKGQNIIKFYFEPSPIKQGSFLQIISIILLISVTILSSKKIFLKIIQTTR